MAVVGTILFIIAAILKLVSQHLNWVLWLVIIGGILIGLDVCLVWRRGGYYRRVP
jgi:hypothetical protein